MHRGSRDSATARNPQDSWRGARTESTHQTATNRVMASAMWPDNSVEPSGAANSSYFLFEVHISRKVIQKKRSLALKNKALFRFSCANKSCGSLSRCAAVHRQTFLSTCSQTDAKQITRSKRRAFLNDQFRFQNTCKNHLIVVLLFERGKTQSAAGGRGSRDHCKPAGQHPIVPTPSVASCHVHITQR